MGSYINALNIVVTTLYALAWADYALLFFRSDPFAQKTAPRLLLLTGIAHGAELILRGIYLSHFPVATVFEALSLIAFAVLVVYLLIEWHTGVHTTGFFIVAFVLVFQFVSSAFIELPETINPLLRNATFVSHVSAAVLGYSAMAISALYGLLYLMLFYHIRKNRFGLIYKQLPSLETMANLNYRAAFLGFIFLTVSIVLGVALLFEVYGASWQWDPKLTVTLLAWIVYGLSVTGHTFWGWSPRRIAFTSLAGFGVILFSMWVVNLIFTSFHEFV